jgi:hypothetical protein
MGFGGTTDDSLLCGNQLENTKKHEKTTKQEDFLGNSDRQVSTQENSRLSGGCVLEALRGLPAWYGCRPPGQ